MISMASQNLLNGIAFLNVSPGQFSGFMLRIEGVTGAAAPTLADFGTIKIKKGKGAITSVPFEDLQIINNLDMGQVESSIGALGGNPFTISALITSSRIGDGNIFDVSSEDKFQFELDLGGISSGNVASGTVTLSAIPQDGVQQYIPNLFIHTPQISLGKLSQFELEYPNISAIYITNMTNCDTLMIEKNKQIACNDSFSNLLALSNMDNRIESAFSDGIKVDLNRSGAMTEALSDEVKIHLKATSAGAAQPTIIVVSNVFDASVYARSVALVTAKAEKILKDKGANSDEVLVARGLN